MLNIISETEDNISFFLSRCLRNADFDTANYFIVSFYKNHVFENTIMVLELEAPITVLSFKFSKFSWLYRFEAARRARCLIKYIIAFLFP